MNEKGLFPKRRLNGYNSDSSPEASLFEVTRSTNNEVAY